MNLRINRWLMAFAFAILGGLFAYSLAPSTVFGDGHHNPRIHKALDALRDARKELDEAPHDFHGQRKDAMAAVDNAIDHLDRIKDL